MPIVNLASMNLDELARYLMERWWAFLRWETDRNLWAHASEAVEAVCYQQQERWRLGVLLDPFHSCPGSTSDSVCVIYFSQLLRLKW